VKGKKQTRRTPTKRRAPRAARTCELCSQVGGDLLWRDKHCRVVLIEDPDYAGYCRVIWNAHVREMTDLSSPGRTHCMRVVLAVEQALRNVLNPHKINLASFGNLTPHVHWHVIPRFADDAHFPNSLWGERRRKQARRAAAPAASKLRSLLSAELLNLL
jgi:diadenosine tetraphosphate (Ap4A) HIT family hydrolase